MFDRNKSIFYLGHESDQVGSDGAPEHAAAGSAPAVRAKPPATATDEEIPHSESYDAENEQGR